MKRDLDSLSEGWRRVKTAASLCIFVLLLAGCATPTTGPAPTAGSTVEHLATEIPPAGDATATTEPAPTAGGAVEYPVTEIPVSGPVAKHRAELSGLAWYGDYLILLPQYPDFAVKEEDGAVFALPKADLLAYLAGARAAPLEPLPIPFVAPGLADKIEGFEGYEAIAFLGDRAFLTIEAEQEGGMKGYLVSGRIAANLSALTLDTTTLVEIEPQSRLENMSYESLLAADDRLVTIYEANGVDVNASPVARLFDTELMPAGMIPSPHVEYRITDATTLDSEGRFWAINYFFPGDMALYPKTDPLAERYGKGRTHALCLAVERLVEFQYTESGIALVDTPPIQLELSDMALGRLGRNWEGLVRLDNRGFLLVTDLFPETILAFVPAPTKQ